MPSVVGAGIGEATVQAMGLALPELDRVGGRRRLTAFATGRLSVAGVKPYGNAFAPELPRRFATASQRLTPPACRRCKR